MDMPRATRATTINALSGSDEQKNHELHFVAKTSLLKSHSLTTLQ
jgi:hypothetical protein